MSVQHVSLCELSMEAWEKCRERLHETVDPAAVRRISIGSYVCEIQFLSWNEKRLEGLSAWAKERDVAFSLVVPCPRESFYDRVCQKAEELLNLLPACDEVVINDEAMARLALFSGKRLTAGRLLVKYEHDERTENREERVRALLRAADGLMDGPWSCVEADSLERQAVWEEASPDMRSRLRFHTPAVMMSSTRHCQFAVTDLGARDLLNPYAGCRQQCGSVWVSYRRRLLKFGRGIYQLLPPAQNDVPDAACVYWPVIEAMEAIV